MAENTPAYQLELIARAGGRPRCHARTPGAIRPAAGRRRRRAPARDVAARIRGGPDPAASSTTRKLRASPCTATNCRASTCDTRLARHYPTAHVGAHALGYVGTHQRAGPRSAWTSERLRRHRRDRQARHRTRLRGAAARHRRLPRRCWSTPRAARRSARAADPTCSSTSRMAGSDLRHRRSTCELQRVAEQAFAGRRGAVVAIDPNNGDVLVFVEPPSFDPNGFAPRHLRAASTSRSPRTSTSRCFNRALRGEYPPGSTIKPLIALGGARVRRRSGRRRPCSAAELFSCPARATVTATEARRSTVSVDMHTAIVKSCDVYFYDLANTLGIERIHDSCRAFGFGEPTGIDIAGERGGIMPSPAWKKTALQDARAPGVVPGRDRDRRHRPGLHGLVTPLQLAQWRPHCWRSRGKPYQPRLVTRSSTRRPARSRR